MYEMEMGLKLSQGLIGHTTRPRWVSEDRVDKTERVSPALYLHVRVPLERGPV